ncbi:uncharacterized protein METZ01_LOCUS468325 [marine metagenome]|uniref:Uncharacterized protein n=1 Tax=marine metagenome TaxID=408172 RepID=A0A383B6H3_9ZZZZ
MKTLKQLVKLLRMTTSATSKWRLLSISSSCSPF